MLRLSIFQQAEAAAKNPRNVDHFNQMKWFCNDWRIFFDAYLFYFESFIRFWLYPWCIFPFLTYGKNEPEFGKILKNFFSFLQRISYE